MHEAYMARIPTIQGIEKGTSVMEVGYSKVVD